MKTLPFGYGLMHLHIPVRGQRILRKSAAGVITGGFEPLDSAGDGSGGSKCDRAIPSGSSEYESTPLSLRCRRDSLTSTSVPPASR